MLDLPPGVRIEDSGYIVASGVVYGILEGNRVQCIACPWSYLDPADLDPDVSLLFRELMDHWKIEV